MEQMNSFSSTLISGPVNALRQFSGLTRHIRYQFYSPIIILTELNEKKGGQSTISTHGITERLNHGQIAKETVHAAAQPHARARLAHPKRPRRGVLLVQQDRGRATYHKKGLTRFFLFYLGGFH